MVEQWRHTCLFVTPEIIIKTLDIILAQYLAELDFEHGDGRLRVIGKAVQAVLRNQYSVPRAQQGDFVIALHDGLPLHENPAFGAEMVPLQGDAATGLHCKFFHNKVGGSVENHPTPPWTCICVAYAV